MFAFSFKNSATREWGMGMFIVFISIFANSLVSMLCHGDILVINFVEVNVSLRFAKINFVKLFETFCYYEFGTRGCSYDIDSSQPLATSQ